MRIAGNASIYCAAKMYISLMLKHVVDRGGTVYYTVNPYPANVEKMVN